MCKKGASAARLLPLGHISSSGGSTDGRSLKCLSEIITTLNERKPIPRSLTEQSETTLGGTLIFHVRGALAEFERSRAFGLRRSMDTLDAVIGPLLGLGLVALLHDRLRLVFAISVIPGLLSVAALSLVGELQPKAVKKASLPKIMLAGLDSRFQLFLLASLIFALGNSRDVFLIVPAKQQGLSTAAVVLAYVLYNSAMVFPVHRPPPNRYRTLGAPYALPALGDRLMEHFHAPRRLFYMCSLAGASGIAVSRATPRGQYHDRQIRRLTVKTRNDAFVASSIRLHRRTLLGSIGALLGSALLAACGESIGAQETASPPRPPTASGGNTGAPQSPAPPPITYPNGVTVSTSVNIPSNGPLSSLVAATPMPPSPPVNGLKTITNADTGTTVNLPTGTQVILALDGDHDWTVTVADQTVLTPAPGALPPGAQGIYAASQPGQTTLTAVGEPLCRKAQPPCSAPTVLFRVAIAIASPLGTIPTVRTITLAENGQTISLPAGTSLLLALDSGLDWQVQIADLSIVSPYPNAAVPPASQGIFTASHQGQTTLTAIGNPKCDNATPRCLAPSRQFSLRIVVT